MIYVDLIFNLGLLVSLSILSAIINKHCPYTTRSGLLLQGLLFGTVAVFGMMRPLVLSPGLIFDGRSIMISLCALFFGPLATLVAALLAGFYRLYLGGAGVLVGILTVLASATIGLLGHFRYNPASRPFSGVHLYFFGLTVHLAIVPLFLTLPGDDAILVIGVPMLLFYPLATILIGRVLLGLLEGEKQLAALRQSKAELAEREVYLRTILEKTAEGFWTISPQGCLVEVNEAYCRLSGYHRDELIGKSISDLEALECPDGTAARIARIMAKGSELFETRHRRKDGSLVDVEVSATWTTVGSGMFICFCRNISERRQAAALQAARLRLLEMAPSLSIPEIHQATLDLAEELTGSRIGFFHHYDEDQQRLFLQAWSTRTGAEFCQAVGSMTHYDLAQAGVWADALRERRPVVHDDFATVANQKGMPEGHAVVRRELVAPVVEQGKIVAVIGVGNKPSAYDLFDDTILISLGELSWNLAVRRMAEEELIFARDAADVSNRAKSTFLANMSHELRTPLNGVLGVLQLLRTTRLDDEQREFVEMGLGAGLGLLDLLRDLLDLSAIEANQLIMEEATFDPQIMVLEVEQTLRPSATGKQLAMTIETAGTLPPLLHGYPLRLRQILFNLLGNAVKYTPRGSVLCRLDFDAGSSRLHLSVRDSGIGMSDEQLQRVFEPFYQVEGSYSRHFQGAGLGLAIVKRLVELMRGEIAVTSKLGVGTEVRMSVPVKIAAADSAPWPASHH